MASTLTELVAGNKLFEYVISKNVTDKDELAVDSFYNDLRSKYTGQDLELINTVINRVRTVFVAV